MSGPHEHDRKLLQRSLDALITVHGGEPVELVINSALSRTGGRAKYKQRTIELASWMLTCPPRDVLNTLRHEFAHIYTHDNSPHASAHGYEWQRAAVLMGAEPSMCYDESLTQYWDKS